MRYIAAYLLLQIGGNSSPSKDDITQLLGTAGVDVDEERLDKLLSELDGKDINSVGLCAYSIIADLTPLFSLSLRVPQSLLPFLLVVVVELLQHLEALLQLRTLRQRKKRRRSQRQVSRCLMTRIILIFPAGRVGRRYGLRSLRLKIGMVYCAVPPRTSFCAIHLIAYRSCGKTPSLS